MKYYITTDTHFGHQMLIDEGLRPKDFENKIWKGLKGIQHSTIIHLGDFCLGNDEKNHMKWHIELGYNRKILVRGNHDSKSDSWYYDQGWDFVCDSFTLRKFGFHILFTHKPILDHGFNLNIHGHWHDNDHRIEPDFKTWYDETYLKLALEENNYQPWRLDTLIHKI